MPWGGGGEAISFSHSHSNFLGQFCPREKGAMRLSLCEAPTRETRPDHNTGNYVPSSLSLSVTFIRKGIFQNFISSREIMYTILMVIF